MKKYIGTKTIEAEPMTEMNFLQKFKNRTIHENDDRHGYLVVYPDGYKSWSPKSVFEAAYHELIFDITSESDNGKILLETVYPSSKATIAVADDPDYRGAHYYQFQDSLGYDNALNLPVLSDTYQSIQFVQKNLDGTMVPGVQSEQLLIALIDRHKKLNEKFPSREGALMITKMEEALFWQQARVKERIGRGVMGDLRK